MEVGERESIYLSLHCHHQNDSCIKTGSDESHSNVSLIVRDKVTRQCPETTIFEETRQCPETTIFEEKGEPNRFEPKSLCLPATHLTARPKQLTTLESVGRKIYSPPALNRRLLHHLHTRNDSYMKTCVCFTVWIEMLNV